MDCLPATDWLPPLSPARLAYAHKHELQFDRSCVVLLLIPPRCSPRSLLPLLLLLLPLLLVAPATAALPLLSWPLALSSGTCRRIHNDANLNTTTTHLRPMPIALQHPPVASRHCASLARPSKNPPARQLRASFF